MVPNSKGFLNRFQLVNVPKTGDLYRRLGLVSPMIQDSGDAVVDVTGISKNDAADIALRESLNEPPISEE